MKTAFLCNNFYHTMVAYASALDIVGDKDIYMCGGDRELSLFPYCNQDIWRYKNEFFLKDRFIDIISSIHSVKNYIRRSANIRYDNIVYFVDKNLVNQMFLIQHAKSFKILVEEGIGLYNCDTNSIIYSNLKEKIYSYLLKNKLMFKGIEQGMTGHHDAIICRFPQLLDDLKSQKKDIYKYNIFLQPSKRELLGQVLNENFYFKKISRRSILYIDSGFSGKGRKWVSEKEEKNVLSRIFSFLKNNGYHIYIKVHPAESKDKFNEYINFVTIINSKFPVELLIPQINPDAVLSFMSTSLLNVADKFKCIYLYNLVNNEFPNKTILKSILTERKNNNIMAPLSFFDFKDKSLNNIVSKIYKDERNIDIPAAINMCIKSREI